MRHHATTIERPRRRPNGAPTRDGLAGDARAWLLLRLRWEHRLAELRAHHELAQNNGGVGRQAERRTGA